MTMFKSPEHRLAGHAAAAKSSKTPAHLRVHKERLAMARAPGNMARLQTVPLHNPGSSLQQPQVSTPVKKTSVRFYQKPVPTTGGKVASGPKVPKGKGVARPFAKHANTHGSGKADFGAPKMPRVLAGTKKMAAIYGG
jgi:hypothetical protein